jgi:hypothetical protein
MVYADYDFYANTYFGRAIAEADFPRLALRGSQYIDYITQGRAEARAGLEAVKMCCCELAEKYQTIETAQELARKNLSAGAADGLEVQSEAVGSWSKSYRSGGDSAQSAANAAREEEAALYSIAQRHLAFTGLLSRAGRCCR